MKTGDANRMTTARQKTRLIILFLIMLTFPITLNYFSVYLIIESAGQGVMAFSFFFWVAFTLTALLLGRAACGWICPLGALQETKDRMAPKQLARIRYLPAVRYVLLVGWLGGIIAAVVAAGGYKTVDLLYNMPSGVSVDSAQSWFTYGTIVLVVLIPVFFIGKRGFCRYFCPWGQLNTAATKIKDFFRWPSLHLRAESAQCKNCNNCDRACPMSLPVSAIVAEAKGGAMKNRECILCGTCADTCPNGVISYSWGRPEEAGGK